MHMATEHDKEGSNLSVTRRHQDLSYITGKHIMHCYEIGWVYEFYLKDSATMDYRVHSGLVAGRWVKNQAVNVVQLGGHRRFKISWSEPTGTAVSLCLNLAPDALQHHGVAFFPHWIHQQPHKSALFQNDHLDEMKSLRDAGPTYPIDVVDEIGEIFFVEEAGTGDEKVITVSPAEFAPSLEKIKRDTNLEQRILQFGRRWGSRDVSDVVNKRFTFDYQNGWHHGLYIRSPTSIDHEIRTDSGLTVSSTESQQAFIVRVMGPARFIVSWTDQTGTSVSLNLDLDLNEIHGVHFFPNWLLGDDGEAPLQDPRAAGSQRQRPLYPLRLVSEFGRISPE